MNKDKEYLLRMDKKLFEQLERYSKHNDLSIAQTARRAIKLFLKETNGQSYTKPSIISKRHTKRR